MIFQFPLNDHIIFFYFYSTHTKKTWFHFMVCIFEQDEYEALKKQQDEDNPSITNTNTVGLNSSKDDQEMVQMDIIQNYNKNIGRMQDRELVQELLFSFIFMK